MRGSLALISHIQSHVLLRLGMPKFMFKIPHTPIRSSNIDLVRLMNICVYRVPARDAHVYLYTRHRQLLARGHTLLHRTHGSNPGKKTKTKFMAATEIKCSY